MKSKPVRLTLEDAQEWSSPDGRSFRREAWIIAGGEVDRIWLGAVPIADRNAPSWEPTSHFTLYVIGGTVDRRLAGYGGAVWPAAWPKLFDGSEITVLGLLLREAALRKQPKPVASR